MLDHTNGGEGGDIHKASFESGMETAENLIKAIPDDKIVEGKICPGCFMHGVAVTTIEYLTFAGIEGDDPVKDIDQSLKDALHKIVSFGIKLGIAKHNDSFEEWARLLNE